MGFLTGGRVVSRPAVAGGVVYVGSEDHNLYALNAANGDKLWNFTTGYYVDSDPAVNKEWFILVQKTTMFTRLNAAHRRVDLELCDRRQNHAVLRHVSDGIVYIGSLDDNIYALNASDGKLVWNLLTGRQSRLPQRSPTALFTLAPQTVKSTP